MCVGDVDFTSECVRVVPLECSDRPMITYMYVLVCVCVVDQSPGRRVGRPTSLARAWPSMAAHGSTSTTFQPILTIPSLSSFVYATTHRSACICVLSSIIIRVLHVRVHTHDPMPPLSPLTTVPAHAPSPVVLSPAESTNQRANPILTQSRMHIQW